jgi:hypothetical protein
MKIKVLTFCTATKGADVEDLFGDSIRALLLELGCRNIVLGRQGQQLSALELSPNGALAKALAPYENIDCRIAVIEIQFDEKRELTVRAFEKKHLEPNEATVDLTTSIVSDGDNVLCGRFIIEAFNTKHLLLKPNDIEPWLAEVVPARYRVAAQELAPALVESA